MRSNPRHHAVGAVDPSVARNDENPHPMATAPNEDYDLTDLIAVVERDDEVHSTGPWDLSDLDADAAELAATLGYMNEPVVEHDEIPAGLVEHVRSITRSRWIFSRVLDAAGTKVLRRLHHNTPEARRARWETRWAPENRGKTKRWLGLLVDREVRLYHQGKVADHGTPSALLPSQEAWRTDKNGVLVIHESSQPGPSFGSPGYMEPTPLKLLRWVHETWLRRHVRGLGDHDVGLDDPIAPRIWDLTAGSGTGMDYFGRLHGSDVVASDLTAVAIGVAAEDCRRVGLLRQHRGVHRGALSRPGLVISSPDIVLFESTIARNTVALADLWRRTSLRRSRSLRREPWMFAVADVAVRAAAHLADGGLVSLLVRCGIRHHAEVEPDPTMLDDLKTVLDGRLTIAHEMPLSYRTTRNQTCFGPVASARGPHDAHEAGMNSEVMTLDHLASYAGVDDLVGLRPSRRWGRACLTTPRSDGHSIATWFEAHGEESVSGVSVRRCWSGSLGCRCIRVRNPKPGGIEARSIDMPSVLDQARLYVINDWLSQYAEKTLTRVAVAFRRGVKIDQTILNAQRRMQRLPFACVIDVKAFYDRISWAFVDRVIEELPGDHGVQALLMHLVRVAVVDRRSGQPVERAMGIPQGLSCSPVFANLVLNEFDKGVAHAISRLGGVVRRYCDDILVQASSMAALVEAVVIIGDRLAHLDLRVKEGTGRMIDTRTEPVDWLGISLGPDGLDVPLRTIENKASELQGSSITGSLDQRGSRIPLLPSITITDGSFPLGKP